MGRAIGEVLAFGAGVALSPLAIIAVVLMLAAPHGRTRAAAFLAGWIVGLGVVGTVVLLVADAADADDGGRRRPGSASLKLRARRAAARSSPRGSCAGAVATRKASFPAG